MVYNLFYRNYEYFGHCGPTCPVSKKWSRRGVGRGVTEGDKGNAFVVHSVNMLHIIYSKKLERFPCSPRL